MMITSGENWDIIALWDYCIEEKNKCKSAIGILFFSFVHRVVLCLSSKTSFFSQLFSFSNWCNLHETKSRVWTWPNLHPLSLVYSLDTIKVVLDQLLNVAPFLHHYTEALERALIHVLNNYYLIQGNSSSQDLLSEAGMIFLTSLNLTSDDISMMRGNFSGLDETFLADIMMESVKLMAELNMFGNESTQIYQIVKQIMASNGTSLLMQKVADLFAWWCSPEASGMQLITQGVPKIRDILRTLFSLLAQVSEDMPEYMEPLEDLLVDFADAITQTSGLLGPMKHRLGLLQQQMSGANVSKVRLRREAPMKPLRGPMDDFIDLFYIDYPALYNALAIQPTTAEILETAHVFFANPNLGVVMKGATRGMPWGQNTSREDTVDAALGVLSFLTVPSMFEMQVNSVNFSSSDS